MLARHSYRGMVWIDLESPTPEEVRALMHEYDLHPAVAEELLKPSLKSKAERFDNCIYLILHFPTIQGRTIARAQEIDFILGQDFIITTRYEDVDSLFKFSKVFEANALIDQADTGNRSGYIFCMMLRNIYRGLESELEGVSLLLERIEDRIFEGQERAMVSELSRVARTLLTFKQTIMQHKDMLDSLEGPGVHLHGQAFAYHLRGIISEYLRLTSSLQSARDMLAELRTTNDSLLSAKQNEIMKTLTIMAFVTFPLTLISSIFGMNTKELPVVGLAGDFWIVLGGMALLAAVFFLYFRIKKWL